MARHILSIWLAAGLAVLAATAAGAETIGVVIRAEGAAAVVAGSAPGPLHVGAQVDREATIETAADGKVLIELTDGSTIAVAPATRLSLAGLVANQERGFVSGVIDLLAGAIRVLAVQAPAERELEVRTGSGVAAVRSTEFFVENSAEGTAVFVWAGRVAVSPVTSSEEVVLSEGEGIDIKQAGGAWTMPREPVRWGAARIAGADERTRVE